MKTDNLVNGYVLSNLFYELMFLNEYGVDDRSDWTNQSFVDDIIRKYVSCRYEGFRPETKQVVRNTLCYLLVMESEDSEMWDVMWQACSAPIPTPRGTRDFVLRCHAILFGNEALPMEDEVLKYRVDHNMHIANSLN